MKSLNELAKEIHQNAVDKGFYDKRSELGTRLMLVVSELSEALEADRKDHYSNLEAFDSPLQRTPRTGHDPFVDKFHEWIKDTVEDEIADAIIRLLDISGALCIDIERHVELKIRYNSLRPHKHGKKY
jgi:NTP pyrophosphatase (non-canonical NTP hydrolase)